MSLDRADNLLPWTVPPVSEPSNLDPRQTPSKTLPDHRGGWHSADQASLMAAEIAALQRQLATLQAENVELQQQNAQLRATLNQHQQDWTAAQQRLENANQAKSTFLATMSHELRTPLHAILGLSQILQQEIFGALNSKQAEYLNHIHASGEHLLLLINDILDLSKIESGRETLAISPIAIEEFCQTCLSLVREQAIEQQLELQLSIKTEIRTCWADERRLRQMVLNLLSNAIKFTPTGTISLIVESQESALTLTVADTGIGIAREHLSQLFQPFCQLDSQLNRQFSGTGLGLVLTQHLAQLHGGDVTVESTLGQGSRFTIVLPPLSAEGQSPLPIAENS